MDYSTNPGTPLQVYMGKGKLWLLGFGCLIFIAIGVWMFTEFLNKKSNFFYGIMGIAGIVFFSACLIFYIRKLFDHSPAVIIDDEGIFDNASYIAGGLIRWEDIQNIQLYELTEQKMIGIKLKDPDAYLERQKGFKRLLIKMNQGMVQSSVDIAQSTLRMPLEQIYKEMMFRWHSHQESRLK